MEIKIIKKEGGTSGTTRIIFTLIGILIGLTVFATGTKYLGSYGVYLAIIISALLSYFGLKNTPKRSKQRIVVWGILGITIFCVIIYIAFVIGVSSMLDDYSLE